MGDTVHAVRASQPPCKTRCPRSPRPQDRRKAYVSRGTDRVRPARTSAEARRARRRRSSLGTLQEYRLYVPSEVLLRGSPDSRASQAGPRGGLRCSRKAFARRLSRKLPRRALHRASSGLPCPSSSRARPPRRSRLPLRCSAAIRLVPCLYRGRYPRHCPKNPSRMLPRKLLPNLPFPLDDW